MNILVKFKPGADKAKVHGKHNGIVKKHLRQIGVDVVDGDLATYQSDPDVLFAEEDRQVHKATNDPMFLQGYLWGLKAIRCPEAWATTKGAVPVAILDTGIDSSHPDLQGQIILAANFSDSTTVEDKDGHGTHVAGIVAAVGNNGIGVVGAAYGTKLMNGKVLGDSGSGGSSWIAEGVIWAADNGAKVINISAGAPWTMDTLKLAIDYATGRDVLVVAAAGNDNSDIPFYPAAYDNVIGVASVHVTLRKAPNSNYGSWVDVAAPGANTYSTLPINDPLQPGGYGLLGGTSQASPHAAAVACLIWSTNPALPSVEVRDRMISTCKPLVVGLGAGLIDAFAAVGGVVPPPVPPPEPPPEPPPVPPPEPPPPLPPVITPIWVTAISGRWKGRHLQVTIRTTKGGATIRATVDGYRLDGVTDSYGTYQANLRLAPGTYLVTITSLTATSCVWDLAQGISQGMI